MVGKVTIIECRWCAVFTGDNWPDILCSGGLICLHNFEDVFMPSYLDMLRIGNLEQQLHTFRYLKYYLNKK